MISVAFALAAISSLSLVSGQSSIPFGQDPRCVKMDAEQYNVLSQAQRDAIRIRAWNSLGIPLDSEFTENVFTLEPRWGNQQVNDNWFCAEGWNIEFGAAVPRSCTPSSINLLDKAKDANGMVTISTSAGTKSTTTITDTETTKVGFGTSMKIGGTASIGVSASVTISFNMDFTRSTAKSQSTTNDNTVTTTRMINVPAGDSTCTASLNQETCQYEVEGKYPIIAQGWVGWRLKNEFTHKDGSKARRWYSNIDTFPREDRIKWATVHAGIASVTDSTVIAGCTKVTDPATGKDVTPAAPAPKKAAPAPSPKPAPAAPAKKAAPATPSPSTVPAPKKATAPVVAKKAPAAPAPANKETPKRRAHARDFAQADELVARATPKDKVKEEISTAKGQIKGQIKIIADKTKAVKAGNADEITTIADKIKAAKAVLSKEGQSLVKEANNILSFGIPDDDATPAAAPPAKGSPKAEPKPKAAPKDTKA